MKKNESQNILRNRILIIIGAVVAVIVALMLFMNVNSNRIVAQNGEYLQTTANQTARRVNDLFSSSLRTVQTAASVFEETLNNPNVNPTDAAKVLDLSEFDHTFFITPRGIAYQPDGTTALATEKEYYIDGIQGESGICYVNDALFDGQAVVAFYAPVNYMNQVSGVVVCVYRESTLTEFMTTTFSNQQTPTYLCQPDGQIIAKAVPERIEKNKHVDDVFADDELEGITIEQVNEDIANGTAAGFTYKGPDGTGNVYITKLESFDWVVMRLFPESITNRMVSNANMAGMVLVAGIVVVSLVVMALFMLQARRQKKELLLERQEATRIIDTSLNLFDSLLSINLANDTYEYFKNNGINKDVPAEGTYASFCEFFAGSIQDANGDTDTIALINGDLIRKMLPPDVPYFQQEYYTPRNDSWFQVSILSLERDANGVPTQVLVAVQNITKHKKAEIESRNALEDAFQAAEHASQAKSDFLNSMSHDIRTPMNSIMGLTAIASMHVDDPERVRECLANITSASRHLLGLINEVLDMAKIESGTIGLSEEDFELSETIESLITIINPQINAKHQDLKVELADIQHEHVIGDPTRLQQVFVNIMGNAIKFTPEGGEISLRIKELPSRVPDSGCYEFVFSDTGVGMSEEFLKTIFEPFTRVNDSRTSKIEGTGLGMAIVKSVVSMMNGTIEVESTEGVGTTFIVTVHLKLRDGKQEDVSSLKDVRVLVVDDDQVACEGACALINDIGMNAEYEMSGSAAIAAIEKADASKKPYRAVILDWQMPEMSGIETAKRIREVSKNEMPIIILSGYDWSMIEQEAREVGVDAFISKPLFRSRLIQVMKNLVAGEVKSITDEQEMLEGLHYKGKRVLLTEDNVMAAAIAKELLGLTGADVEHAENGKLAVEMLQEHEPGYYDVVLMDIQMPIMNGYEATAAIREAGAERRDLAEIPIIALSADAFAEDVKQSQTSGMNDHMAKPLEIDTLVKMLQKWVD